MNKYFALLALLSQTIFFTHAAPANPFIKLTPKISKQAQHWAEKVAGSLTDELQLAYLNLFALNSENSIPAFIKCAEYIESLPAMLPLWEELGTNIMETLKHYAENVQEKIENKKNITDEEKETLWQKLDTKIQELVAYINAIYYQSLYGVVAKKKPSAAMYMFDDKGIIPQEKRTQSLPQPL